jgi:four helix bundle protein
MEKFRELIVWQRAHALCLWVYRATQAFPKHELFGLTSQMRRNGQSIPSNIAEGSKRRTTADWNHYNVIAEGSLEELKYQIILSRDLGYLTDAQHDDGMRLCQEVGYLLHAYAQSLK